MRRILSLVLCFVIQIATFSNMAFAQTNTFTLSNFNNSVNVNGIERVAATANGFGILSTSAWPEEAIVKFGKNQS